MKSTLREKSIGAHTLLRRSSIDRHILLYHSIGCHVLAQDGRENVINGTRCNRILRIGTSHQVPNDVAIARPTQGTLALDATARDTVPTRFAGIAVDIVDLDTRAGVIADY